MTGRPLAHLYTHSRWRSLRLRQLKREPLCCMCEAEERTTLATICDHVEPHRGDLTKFWAGPFQSLCKQHHDSDKARIEGGRLTRQRFGADGEPIE